MPNYLITGYHGEPHVTAENDRGINAAIFGTRKVVLPVGRQFFAEYIGNNTVRMYDGKLSDNGAAAGIPSGEYVDLLIAEAGQGKKRNDLIVFQYSQDSSTLVESGSFVVVKGAETTSSATDPVLTEGDLLSSKTTFDQMALWRVSVSGATISAPVQLFQIASSSEITKAAIEAVLTGDITTHTHSQYNLTKAKIESLLTGTITSHTHNDFAPIVTVSASKTLALTDAQKLQRVSSTSAVTITIPLNTSVAFPIGTEIEICRYGSGTVTIKPASTSVYINGETTNKTITEQYGCVALKKIETNKWIISGAWEA